MQVMISKDENVAGRVVEHVQSLEAEVNVLKHLDHPNIVRYLVRLISHFPAFEVSVEIQSVKIMLFF